MNKRYRKMILVSVSSTEDKFVIRLNHKINYVIENKFGKIKSLERRTLYVIAKLFLLIPKLIFKEIFLARQVVSKK